MTRGMNPIEESKSGRPPAGRTVEIKYLRLGLLRHTRSRKAVTSAECPSGVRVKVRKRLRALDIRYTFGELLTRWSTPTRILAAIACLESDC